MSWGKPSLKKSVKFDPASTVRSEDFNARESIPQWKRKLNSESDSEVTESDDGQQYFQDSSLSANVRRFISSKEQVQELNESLRESLVHSQKEQKRVVNNKKLIETISAKQPYPQKNLQEIKGGEIQVGGIKLDEKTLLEEAFINFRDLLRQYRVRVVEELFKSEQKNRSPPLIVNMKIGMSDETYDLFRYKRHSAWRGFVNRLEFQRVISSFGLFETVMPEVMDGFIQRVYCLDINKDWVNYMKLIACVYRFKSSISHLTKKFLMIDYKNGGKRTRTFRKFDEGPATETICNGTYEYRQRQIKKQLLNKAQEQARKDKKEENKPVSEQDKLRLSMNESAENLITILREKVAQSSRSLQEIFSIMDEDNDQIISKNEFKSAFKKAGIQIDESILDKAFLKFDMNQDDKVSFNEFLSVIFGQEKKTVTSISQLQSSAEDIISEIRRTMISRFNNRKLFLSALYARNPQKVTMEEFCNFLTKNTYNEFSKIQMRAVFTYLDFEDKKYLKQDEFIEIYEHQVQKEEINQYILQEQQRKEQEKRQLALQQEEESELLENEAKSFYDQNVSKKEGTRINYLTKLQQQTDAKYEPVARQKNALMNDDYQQHDEDIEEEITLQEHRKKAKEARERTAIFLQRSYELEHVMKAVSDQIQDRLAKSGKPLRDLFNVFSRKVFGYLDQEEFIIMVNFLCRHPKISEDVVKACFFLFAQYYTRRLSYEMFQNLIQKGANLNPLYLKFKFRFGNNLDRLKKKIFDDFQRVDESRGEWIITMEDFKKILELNQIQFSPQDEKRMQLDKLIMSKDNQDYVKYKLLLPILFPQNTQIQQDILSRHSKTIARLFQLVKLRKYRLKYKEEQEKKKSLSKKSSKDKKRTTFSRDSKAASAVASKEKKSTTKAPLKKNDSLIELQKQKSEENELKKVGEFMKAKEGVDIFSQEDTDHAQTPSKNDLAQSTGQFSSKGKNRMKTSGKMSEETIPLKVSEQNLLKQQKGKITEICLNVLGDIIDSSVGFGESLILSKEIQRKYEERPVIKDVFVCLKDMEAESIDILPKCIFSSSQTGRIMVLDKDTQLHQYDIVSKRKLLSLDLSIKVPLREAQVLDAAFDSNSGRFYILTDRWNIEVWDIGQDSSSPVCTIVLFSENVDTQKAVRTCYQRRHSSAFPHFLTLSEHSHQVIIVNSTCVNNCLIFVDPISLCVFNVLYISPGDFHMSTSLTNIINNICTDLLEFQNKGNTFESLFEGKVRLELDGVLAVQIADFQEGFQQYFGKHLQGFKTEDWNDLGLFLDQNNSGLIQKSQFEFIFEMIKYNSVRLLDSNEQLIKLTGISEGGFLLLNNFSRVLKNMEKTVEDAFKAFDCGGGGNISCQEFEFIIQRICKGDQYLQYSKELTKFIDKNANGLIDFSEFEEILRIAADHENQGIQFHGRKNLLLCIQKAYEGGIDVEQLLISADTFKEGTISSVHFRNLLKWLPIGMTEDELDYVMQNTVSYAENGGVNYIKLLTSTQFKSIKENFTLKKSMAQQKEYEKYNSPPIPEKTEEGFTSKVIIESMIYLDDFDLIIYTTVCPFTSIIFIAKSNKLSESDQSNQNNSHQNKGTDLFSNKILAKLSGHKSFYPPTIKFVSESGCLISGEKLSPFVPPQTLDKSEANLMSRSKFKDTSVDKEEKNQTLDQNRSADILIWNLQKDLFSSLEANPPWIIQPSRIIESAHYDSIVSFTYLPYSQLIASSSLDNTIKLWNPIARPYPLVNQDGEPSVQIKPGYYKKAKQEFTVTNEPFAEVRRIYTGDQISYGLFPFTSIIPVLSNPDVVGDQLGKRMNIIELLITCNLSQTEFINKRPRNPCTIR